jgi:hypothetical protein
MEPPTPICVDDKVMANSDNSAWIGGVVAVPSPESLTAKPMATTLATAARPAITKMMSVQASRDRRKRWRSRSMAATLSSRSASGSTGRGDSGGVNVSVMGASVGECDAGRLGPLVIARSCGQSAKQCREL